MANFYVRSTDGSDADNGSTWALAKATLAGAVNAAVAGDTIYVSQVHAETQATTISLSSPGTAASPCRILCVNDAAEPPTALATTATITATSSGNITFIGFAYCYGITFASGSGSSGGAYNWISASPWWWKMEQCTFARSGTGVSQVLCGNNSTSSDDQLLEWVNCTYTSVATTDRIVNRCRFKWRGGACAGTAATGVFSSASSGNGGMAELSDVDLSVFGSGDTLVTNGATNYNTYLISNCKLGASVSITSTDPAGQGGVEVRLINCDSADTNYRYFFQSYQGTITHETTIIRTGGASDGTTPISRKMVTGADSKFFSPLLDDRAIPAWNETTGSAITVTIPVLTNNVTLTDADAWIEVEYLGTSGFPLGVNVSDRATNVLTTPANQTTDGVSSWASAPGTPIKQLLAVTFTPQEKGLIQARVALARASTTLYYDPLLQVT